MTVASIPSPTFSEFHIGPLTIHMYAICILIGVCFAVWILSVRWRKLGGIFDQVLDTTLVAVPSGLVGARLYHCITTPEAYFPPSGELINIVKVWEGGMAIFGGISVGALGAFLWCRHRRYPFALLADALAPGLMVAQAIGRLGNWFNQELYGKPTTLPWGLALNDADAIGKTQVCYNGQPCPVGTLFHPTFLYEMLWNLVGAALLVVIGRRLAGRLKAGQQFAMYLMWYGVGRTWIEMLRINFSTEILGLRINVWTALIVFVLGVVLFLALGRRGHSVEELSKRLTAVTADELERINAQEQAAKEARRRKGGRTPSGR
ncbi:prolipoprotein diacylglyceryl transferase [Bifidobacterium sp. SMB2]|uniref:Phosphatidylglycerol--prolipoprotein diacylglyceryl transferase n=1 Tax=Bifidobacterium saimiriisciurei TaxID=2661627 RepID=A0ABX0CCL0_9BIFI|nr:MULTISPECIES: prolipoprotein diacylglyceryl transferase [Bifidobacterium]NEG96816.1 prolipoprotein diacylglyceryl transferase [Bifidobacterium sp. SMB2]NEH12285.1 prolipoprotein diacylglyceryl transferase [Bifidobacterium saimiriisciurei]